MKKELSEGFIPSMPHKEPVEASIDSMTIQTRDGKEF
jgi:hypothetical protein